VFTADPAITAPTLISVPARVYPNGYAVECGGCTIAMSSGELAVTRVTGTATITIRP
jgi:hypothetical protein